MKEAKRILLLLVLSRLALTVVGMLAVSESNPLAVWDRWDVGWYLEIAKNGYRDIDFGLGTQKSYAFLPLYPLLARLLSRVTGDLLSAGLILSNAAFFVGLVYLYRLARLDYGERASMSTVEYAILFPMGLFFSAFLSESLFFMLAVMSFYYCRKRMWFRVGVLGFLASLTRIFGILLLVPILLEYARKRKIGKDILPLSLIPLGLLVFVLYIWAITGDYLMLSRVQGAWGRILQSPLDSLYGGFHTVHGTAQTALGFSLYAVFCTAFMLIKRMRSSYVVYSLLAVFAPLSFGLMSMPRFVIAIFPLYIVTALLTERRKTVRIALCGIFSALSVCYMVFWSLWYPIVY
jgi:hypothetical protein